MVKIFKQRSFLFVLVALFVVVSSSGGYAFAATAAKTSTPAANGNVNSIRISPLRTDITIERGQTGTVTFNITNLTNEAAVYQAVENDFVAGDEKGTPAVILSQDSYAPTHSLKRFMIPIGNVTVPAGATQAVKLTIKVPTSAQPGGYFGALRFAPATPGTQQLSLASSAASLVLLTVPGPTTEKLALTNFDVQQNGQTATNFRTAKDLSVLVRFANQGNLQEAPFGQVVVMKGKKLLYTYNFNQNSPKDEVLPDSARHWSIPLKSIGVFGKYTVTGVFTYGNGQSVQVSKAFWIVPTKYLVAVGAGVVILILLIVAVVHSIRKARHRNRYRGRH